MTKSWLNTISQKCAFQSSAHKKMAKKINLRENQWHKIWEDYITSCQRGWTSGCCQKYIAAVLIYIIFALALSIQTDNNDKFEHFPFRKGPIFRCLKDYAEQLPRGDVKPVHYFCSGDKQWVWPSRRHGDMKRNDDQLGRDLKLVLLPGSTNWAKFEHCLAINSKIQFPISRIISWVIIKMAWADNNDCWTCPIFPLAIYKQGTDSPTAMWDGTRTNQKFCVVAGHSGATGLIECLYNVCL